jgi:phage shock protein PspC (stress-responsive transcriptional regulator)
MAAGSGRRHDWTMPNTSTPQPAPETESDSGNGSGNAHTPPPLAGNRFFAWMRSLDLTREPGWIGGVAAGTARRLGIDPLIVRGILVVVAVLGGPALLLYAAGWLLLPDRDDKIHLEEVFKGRLDSPIAGIGALILLSMLPVTRGFWYAGSEFWGEPYWGAPFWGASFGHAVWTVAVLAATVWFIVWVARRSGRASNAPTTGPASTVPTTAQTTEPSTAPTTATGTAQTTDDAAAPAASAAAFVAGATAPGLPGARPPAPAATATAEEFAAWRAQQAQWKAQNDAFRARQSSEQRAASLAAQAQYRQEREARRAIERAQHARTRSNPLYSFVAIGLALVVGGIVTVTHADGAVEPAGILAGLGAALVVLAVAIIVNGARGKRPGGSQGVAALVLIPLLVAAVLPHDPHVSYTGDPRFAPSDEPGWNREAYFVGTGHATLDLRGYWDSERPAESATSESDEVFLVVGSGDTTVYVPRDEYVEVSITSGIGSVSTPGLEPAGATSSGRFSDDLMRYSPADDPDWTHAIRTIQLTIVVGAGDVTILREATADTTTGDTE